VPDREWRAGNARKRGGAHDLRTALPPPRRLWLRDLLGRAKNPTDSAFLKVSGWVRERPFGTAPAYPSTERLIMEEEE